MKSVGWATGEEVGSSSEFGRARARAVIEANAQVRLFRAGTVHILYTLHRFWPAIGGTELAMMDLGREMVKLGHRVTLATSDEPGTPAVEDVQGLDVHRFALKHMGKFRFPPRAYADFVLEGGAWDIVHVKGQRVWSSDYLFGKMGRVAQPKVFTAHGFHQWHMHRRDPAELWYYRWHLPRMLRKFDRIIALTQNEADELSAFGVDRGKIVIIPEGVNLEEFKEPPPRTFRSKYGVTAEHMLLYAGGFYDNKRVDLLVRAVAEVESDVELVVIGRDHSGGTLRAECEQLAARLDAPVRFLGVVDRQDLIAAFFENDLFLFASDFEGYGIVLLESLAAGVPFVARPAGAARDLAQAGCGLIAETPSDMAAAIDDLLRDAPRRARMGAAGKRLAHAQTQENAARQHAALYRTLL